MSDLTDKQREVVELLADRGPFSTPSIGTVLGISTSAARNRVHAINEKHDGTPIERNDADQCVLVDESILEGPTDDTDADLPDFEDIEAQDADPSPNDLTDREAYLIRQLQEGATVTDLADDIGERKAVVVTHLRELRRDGWQIYHDETTNLVAIEGDHALRSSEHKGTRTRKANRWWERTHNGLVREFKSLEAPTADIGASPTHEDWVTHVTDIHAGDRVRTTDQTDVYGNPTIPRIIRYITERSLSLAELHNATYDTAHLLWGGDFITNEGIYEGQFEDLDAWLDEQHDMLADPLLRQLKAFADEFETVNVVAQVGNHGNHRASGTSRQANADLILYKSIRNTVAEVRKHSDVFNNVNFVIGEARPYVNFDLRGGRVTGHLRHGQDRRPQAETSARSDQWMKTLHHHEFDIAWMGHHHVSGRIPWDGPPIIVSGSPKPPGTFVEKIAASASMDPRKRARDIATCHGVADHGITGVYPIRTHKFDYVEASAVDAD